MPSEIELARAKGELEKQEKDKKSKNQNEYTEDLEIDKKHESAQAEEQARKSASYDQHHKEQA